MPKYTEQQNLVPRPPVIVITGHIDHGKSSLLDYIRKTNIVDKEAGGITQHLSAYQVEIPAPANDNSGHKSKTSGITFLDTPGHEAFSGMRARGVEIADIAILIVSAEDGVKAQTIESLKTIREAGLPFIVAINKIDKPSANVEKTKNELVEKEVYLEGYGGDIPFVPISAKTGEGVPELLDMILLVSELKELKSDLSKKGAGVVIESHMDQQRGISSTLIIKDGTVKKGDFIVIDGNISPIRILENFLGKPIDEARAGTPLKMAGFSNAPQVGSIFKTFANKKGAGAEATNYKAVAQAPVKRATLGEEESKLIKIIPLTLKADTSGTLEALENEVSKISVENVIFKIIKKGVGAVGETEIKLALSTKKDSIVIGFNVKCEPKAKELAEREGVTVACFDVIYKMTEWLKEESKKRKPKVVLEETTGKAKILRCFNRERARQVVGGRVLEGTIAVGETVKILRRDYEVGKGEILELQAQKIKTKEVGDGKEFGLLIDSKMDVAEGDVIEAYRVVEK